MLLIIWQKAPLWESSLRPAPRLKKILRQRCVPVNLNEISKNPFLKNTSGFYFLINVLQRKSKHIFVKIWKFARTFSSLKIINMHCWKYARIWFSLTAIFPYKNRIVLSGKILVREIPYPGILLGDILCAQLWMRFLGLFQIYSIMYVWQGPNKVDGLEVYFLWWIE